MTIKPVDFKKTKSLKIKVETVQDIKKTTLKMFKMLYKKNDIEECISIANTKGMKKLIDFYDILEKKDREFIFNIMCSENVINLLSDISLNNRKISSLMYDSGFLLLLNNIIKISPDSFSNFIKERYYSIFKTITMMNLPETFNTQSPIVCTILQDISIEFPCNIGLLISKNKDMPLIDTNMVYDIVKTVINYIYNITEYNNVNMFNDDYLAIFNTLFDGRYMDIVITTIICRKHSKEKLNQKQLVVYKELTDFCLEYLEENHTIIVKVIDYYVRTIIGRFVNRGSYEKAHDSSLFDYGEFILSYRFTALGDIDKEKYPKVYKVWSGYTDIFHKLPSCKQRYAYIKKLFKLINS